MINNKDFWFLDNFIVKTAEDFTILNATLDELRGEYGSNSVRIGPCIDRSDRSNPHAFFVEKWHLVLGLYVLSKKSRDQNVINLHDALESYKRL